jgi:hypothetical protein
MKNGKCKVAYYFIGLLSHIVCMSQPSVAGASCVMPGIIYQYNISGKWDSTSKMQICFSDGVIEGTSDSCTANTRPLSFIQVIWKAGTSGSIQVLSSSGATTFSVSISTPLNGGSINSQVKSQEIAYDTVPAIINCTPSTGGSCSPQYLYQWQQSFDMVTWTDILGASAQNLGGLLFLKETTFFRRKVTETSSGSIAYSDIALADVHAPPPSVVGFDNSKVRGNDSYVYNSWVFKNKSQ